MSEDFKKYRKLGMRTNSASFKSWYDAGLLQEIDEDFLLEAKAYWSEKSSLKPRTALHLAFMNLTGRKDVRLVPTNIMNYEVLPVFNDYNLTEFYGDKNIYDLVIKPPNSAVSVLRAINGKYFNPGYDQIDIEEASGLLRDAGTNMIIKPSRSNNGTGISRLSFQDDKIFIGDEEIRIDALLKKFGGNFIVQEMLKQHPNMAAPHPGSVNTIRMVTFRWKNEIRYLLAFARFGSDGDIRDNANVESSPRVGVKDNGEFFEYGIGQSGEKFTEHPTTGFKIADLQPIPNYEEFKQFVKDTHKNFLHLDFVSWDIAVGVDWKPVFIEANFAGSTSFYQLVSQRSIFGDMTEEVMAHVKAKVIKNHKVPMGKYFNKRKKKLKAGMEREKEKKEAEIIELKKKIKEASEKRSAAVIEKKIETLQRDKERLETKTKKEKKELMRELNHYKKKYEKVEQSTSWRITGPVRKVKSLLKK
ncbi:sugar-transfer associated ATP-grasp domain-containing protein [Salinicoccus halitifaciens]|uniref:Alpha-L-glutamate ligase-related protein ATP-grasp domain-containing protein n=1 Tax=Salinicoccus halitifaciens TaxID=1073415 RepID=A0ABV2EBZ7_9STAP|nr:sugar-transfer associated ATP-grasp domain-containing protein [Salinicoccus halitifaciens]MCD2137383.1 hypothetical protein [Salinicoccus halitifaciens]